ncbi:Hypothetical predicted protein [Marmota monax]|uniref:Uncharacterized protein n=1 Tax=Marmota monax TaxID=9995 RepID=A0A5E4AS79_MARMO|nr:hypothetical protein GHT09_009310 [Marmota monax]VTJ59581.1 Hypothetical predicted protein [Marmota monax]
MAASEGGPQGPRAPSLQRAFNSLRTGSPSVMLHSEKERYPCWSSFPMGQKQKSTFSKDSSYLLQQLIHRYQESEAEGEDYQGEPEGEGESEESSESEMLNLEEEFDGVLREEVVAKALHELGRSGPGTEQVYLNLTLSGKACCPIVLPSPCLCMCLCHLVKGRRTACGFGVEVPFSHWEPSSEGL